MPRYTAYQLLIDSDLPLPEMEPAPDSHAAADVVIRFAKVDRAAAPDADGLGDRFIFHYPESGTFHIKAGREIVIDRDPAADEASIRVVLTGPVLGILLHQRGYLLLHASCVSRGQTAIAFAADSGTGKSTLAAAFTARGFALVTDDIVAVDLAAPGGPRIFPGFFQMKLSEQSARSIGVEWDNLADLGLEREKRGHRPAGAAHGSLALRRIYLPADDTCEAIEPLSSQRSFGQLIHHSYALAILKETGTQAKHFQQAAQLAGAIPVCKLRRRRSLDLLPAVVEMVERDLAQDSQ